MTKYIITVFLGIFLGICPVLPQKKSDISIYLKEAEKCFTSKCYEEALSNYEIAFEIEQNISPRHYYNAAYVAAILTDTGKVLIYMNNALKADNNWYVSNLESINIFRSLHSDPQWQILADTIETRKFRIEKDYDTPLRDELFSIMNSDQSVRRQYIVALNAKDSVRVDSLVESISVVDSINLIRIIELLDTRGWAGKDKVGNASNIYFLILQHASLEIQKKYLPYVRSAAQRGDIQLSNLAMFEDRIAVSEGRKQIYGTQIIKDDSGRNILAPLEDPETVNVRRANVGLGPIEEYLKNWDISWE